jgi:hypothetical protein
LKEVLSSVDLSPSSGSNASIGGTHLKEKGLHIFAPLEIANFSASNVWISRFKRSHNIAYRNLSGGSRSVHSETVGDWKNYRLLQETDPPIGATPRYITLFTKGMSRPFSCSTLSGTLNFLEK